MATVLFDTLKFVRELRPAFSQEQAEALATAVAASAQDTVATKADLSELRAELKGEIAAVRADLIELKADLGGLRAELKGDAAGLRAELKGDLAAQKNDFVRWMVTAVAFNFVATAGFIVLAMRVFR